MYMELTKKDDHSFLYTFQVSEDEFQELKTEQSLLVDFSSFPVKFVELLYLCSLRENDQNKGKASNKNQFLAVLNLVGSPVFKIVEANQFKQLTHLSLHLQLATETILIDYLTNYLSITEKLSESRLEIITQLESSAKNKDNEISLQNKEIKELRTNLQTIEDQITKKYSYELNKQKEESIKLVSQTQTVASEQAFKQKEQADARIQYLESHIEQLQIDYRTIIESKSIFRV